MLRTNVEKQGMGDRGKRSETRPPVPSSRHLLCTYYVSIWVCVLKMYE